MQCNAILFNINFLNEENCLVIVFILYYNFTDEMVRR